MRRTDRTGIIVLAVLIALIGLCVLILIHPAFAAAEGDNDYQVWALLKPGDYVNVRLAPNKKSSKIGYLDAGDGCWTDGKTKNGFLHVYGVGETDGWVYKWYMVTEKPEVVNEYYVVTAIKRVICRKGVGGPRIKGRLGWMKNGTRVKVFCIAGEWALTNRGYVKSEWLEVDPG